MPDVYRAANVLIVTSDLEGGPSCVKEALACGLPVVSVPVGDVRVLEETPEASIIASRDPEELGRALEKAFYKPEGRASRLPPALTLRASISRIREVYEAAWRDHQAKSRARDAEVA